MPPGAAGFLLAAIRGAARPGPGGPPGTCRMRTGGRRRETDGDPARTTACRPGATGSGAVRRRQEVPVLIPVRPAATVTGEAASRRRDR
jgi:hypothetical protein